MKNYTNNNAVFLKKRMVSGLVFSVAKKGVAQVIQTSSGIIVARLLFPQILGAFSIISIYAGIFGLFAVAGLGMALIQKKEEPSAEEMRSVFLFDLFLSLLVTLLAIFFAPVFYRFYQQQLGEKGVFYLRLMSLSLLASGLKTIPIVKLRRELNYRRLVVGELIESGLMHGLAVFLALKGWGILGLIVGNLVGAFGGVAAFFILAPLSVGGRFSWSATKKLFPYGLNYQINNIISVANGAITPILVGKITGSAAVGLLSWASGVAAFPRSPSDVLGQVIFLACCRSQEDKKLLRVFIEKSIQLSCFVCFPMITVLAALAYPTAHIVYTDKWLGGVPALYIFSLQSFLVVINTILTQVLLALGEAKIVRNIVALSTALQWILTIPLISKVGFVGVPIVATIISLNFIVALIFLRRKVKFEVTAHIFPYLAYSFLAGAVAYIINQYHPARSILELVFIAGVAGLFYLLPVWLFEKEEILDDMAKLRRYFFSDIKLFQWQRDNSCSLEQRRIS